MQIDFYADLTCPWCHLGWRRLQQALAQRAGPAVDINWKPYQLNPDIPVTGMDRQEYLLRKFANTERVREVMAAIETAMRADGVHVNLHRIKTMSNTYLGHRLMLLASKSGKMDNLLNEFFVAYFVQGKDVGDSAVLKAIAEAAGLDAKATERELHRHDPDPIITQSEHDARQLGIRAVPYMLFDGKYSIAGAHDPVAFLPLIELSQLGI
jgi:predicted DsbA family dithiol-disulfide isomerase